MNYEWLHRLATIAGLALENRLMGGVAARAAFCVGYDRYMDQAVKDQIN